MKKNTTLKMKTTAINNLKQTKFITMKGSEFRQFCMILNTATGPKVRAYFYYVDRLYQAYSKYQKLSQKEMINQQNSKNFHQTIVIDHQNEHISNQETIITDKQKNEEILTDIIKRMDKNLKNQNSRIDELSRNLNQQEIVINNQGRTISDQQTTIDELKTNDSQQEINLNEVFARLDRTNERVNNLRINSRHLRNMVQNLGKDVDHLLDFHASQPINPRVQDRFVILKLYNGVGNAFDENCPYQAVRGQNRHIRKTIREIQLTHPNVTELYSVDTASSIQYYRKLEPKLRTYPGYVKHSSKSVVRFGILTETDIQRAMNEVSDALVAIEKLKEEFIIAQERVVAAKKALKDASFLFRSGLANYLEVITAQRESLDSELNLENVKSRIFLAEVELYRSLGGGWR